MARRVKKALMEKRKITGTRGLRIAWPAGCMEGTYRRPYWLPKGWLNGVKLGTSGYTGRGLQVYITPEGKKFYHKKDVQKFLGRVLTTADGEPPSVEEMLPNVLHNLRTPHISMRSEQHMMAQLTPAERACLPSADAFRFCVISARRTSTQAGMLGCLRVQAQFEACGVRPRWYVDEASLERYCRLGLDAVKDGGGLVRARNKALDEAARDQRVCCQVSDDIMHWHYSTAGHVVVKSDAEANAENLRAKKLVVSPVAAARCLLAKMRASSARPKLGGVYPNENIARALFAPAATTRSFILGDFFVCEPTSRVRFDCHMTLKEDFDFSCAHIQEHGTVLRCNRMYIVAKHRTNAGGACTVRNSQEEQKNIKILRQKWPRAIRAHTVKKDEVILQWPKAALATEDD